jgi:arylsulfatase A-like enzyme
LDKKLVVVLLGLLGVVAAAFPLTDARPGGPDAARPETEIPGTADPPNILIVMTDDQRLQGTMAAMPETRARIGGQGVFYPRAVSNTPICCPARAIVMTGRYAHNHGVIDNNSATKLDMATTMQARLKQIGYHTAIFGKFLNRFPPPDHPYLSGTLGKYFDRFPGHPPFFDRYFFFDRGQHYENARWNDQGSTGRIKGYSTDLIANKAIAHLEDLEATDDQPWYFYVTPVAPHGPYVPADRYGHSDVPRWQRPPSIDEIDRSDKLNYVLNETVTNHNIRRVVRLQLQTLYSVDDLVEQVDETLERLGEQENTLVFYMTDNGYLWGDHGMLGTNVSKNNPYRGSVTVPLMMRWPGKLEEEGKSQRPVGLVDVAPTIYDAIGLPPGNVDGRSLLADSGRRWSFVEYRDTPETPNIPTWASLRSRSATFTEYFEGGKVFFREYYDLRNDPWENTNLLEDGLPGNDPPIGKLHRLIVRMRNCEGRDGPDRCI